MKIEKSRLNPLYHQYSNPENRLTHALLHTVTSSKWIFSRFMRQIANYKKSINGKNFEATTQKVPFQQADNDPGKIESIPDAWIVDNCAEIGIAIEVKDIKNSISLTQLISHSKRILNYKTPCLLVITPDLQKPKKVQEFHAREQGSIKVVWQSWDSIYRWLKTTEEGTKSRSKDHFLIISLLEYLERRREVLGFQGIFFRSGFNVGEAKDILNAEMETIQPSFNSVYPNLIKRRPAITTISQESVWDCFGNEDGFTSEIHFTFSIHETYHDIAMTIPNSAKKIWSRLKFVFSESDSEAELFKLLKELRNNVPFLYIELIQRHFEHRRFGIRDGFMEFDIDTLGSSFRSKDSKAKEFPVWKLALREAIINKKNVNAQVKFNSRFYFNKTKDIDSPEFVQTAQRTVKAYKPLYDFLC